MDPLKERTMYLFSKISKSEISISLLHCWFFSVLLAAYIPWIHNTETCVSSTVFLTPFSTFWPSFCNRTFKRPSLAFHITQIFYWYWQTLISLTSLWEEKKAAKPVPSLLFFVHMSKWGNVSFGPGDFSDLDPRHSICLFSLKLLSALCLGVYWWRLGANLNKLSKLLFFSGENLVRIIGFLVHLLSTLLD